MLIVRMKKMHEKNDKDQEPEYFVRRIPKPRNVSAPEMQYEKFSKPTRREKVPQVSTLPESKPVPVKFQLANKQSIKATKVAKKSSQVSKPIIQKVTIAAKKKRSKVTPKITVQPKKPSVKKAKVIRKKDKSFLSLKNISFKRSHKITRLSPIKDVLRHSKASKVKGAEDEVLLKNEIKAQPVFKTEEAETKNSELKTDFPKLEAEPVDVIEYPNVCVDFPKKTDPEDGTETPEQDTTARKFYSESEVEKFEKKQIYQNTVLKYRYRWIPENDRQVFHIPRGLTPTQLVAVEQFAFLIRTMGQSGKVSVRVKDSQSPEHKSVKRNFTYSYEKLHPNVNSKTSKHVERIDNYGAIGLIFF